MSREEEMKTYLEKAKVLVEALPYIQRFNRKIIVVKRCWWRPCPISSGSTGRLSW